MPNFHYADEALYSPADLAQAAARYPYKYAWFLEKGYTPQYWQALFHTNTDPTTDNLCRYRHLVAGRRGGKTLCAAWETVFYALHPEVFHYDAHGVEDDRPLHIWVLTKDYPTGMAALLAIRGVLKDAGLTHGVEYRENRGNRWFEFENGSFLQFKTADDPESLRGAGLDILWIDEAAFIPTGRAWEVASPALGDHQGIIITTTTPSGKNWFYKEFWGDDTKNSPDQGRVEYRSIDSEYFPEVEWRHQMRRMHPMIFRQEFMASFDAMAGRELQGDWLHYYEYDQLVDKYGEGNPKRYDETLNLNLFIGVDPAISLSDKADRFVISLVGVTKDRTQAYLLEQFAGRIPFPEQVDLISEWHQKWRPQVIGIEKNAYQAALAQQVQRLATFPPVAAIWTKGKKPDRILSMSPLFRIGKVLIRKDHQDFINEWVDYDSTRANPDDDCLDSVEIALRTAGVLLPVRQPTSMLNPDHPIHDIEELARRDRPGKWSREMHGVDEHLGGDW